MGLGFRVKVPNLEVVVEHEVVPVDVEGIFSVLDHVHRTLERGHHLGV
jgi:hypothetical protein